MSRRSPLARVDRRPQPEQWSDDDDMTLQEYIAVFYPDGPLTVASLRTEIAKGRLTPSEVAGKFFITPAAVRALLKAPTCPAKPKAPASTSGRARPPPHRQAHPRRLVHPRRIGSGQHRLRSR
jgi:hypothetical protein